LPIAAAIDDDPKSAWAVDPEFGKDHAAVFETEGEVGFDGGTVLTFHAEIRETTPATTWAGSGCRWRRCRARWASTATMSRKPWRTSLPCLRKTRTPNYTTSSEASCRSGIAQNDETWKQLNLKVEEHQKTAAEGRPWPRLSFCSEGVAGGAAAYAGGRFPSNRRTSSSEAIRTRKESVATQSFLQVVTRSSEAGENTGKWPHRRDGVRRTAAVRFANWITDVDDGGGQLAGAGHREPALATSPRSRASSVRRATLVSRAIGRRIRKLLDWLASELVRNGWRLKPIHKLILMSSVYPGER